MVSKKTISQQWMKLFILGKITRQDLLLHIGELPNNVITELEKRRDSYTTKQ